MTEIDNIIKEKLIWRINNLNRDKINALESFLNRIETSESTKDEILSYAGIFKDLESDLFLEITDKLHSNRKLGRNRIL